MKTFITLIRGINVGGKNIVPMAELTQLLNGNGYAHVQTYIQSGNVILQSKSVEPETLTTLIEKKFGFRPHVVVIEAEQFTNIAQLNPYKSENGKTVHLYFCAEPPVLNEEKLTHYKADSETYEIIGNVFYLSAPEGIGRSKLAANIEACLGVAATGRNLNTIAKLTEMLCEY